MGIGKTIRNAIPWLYQRFQPWWERGLIGGGFAGLFLAVARALNAYPPEWRGFLGGVIVALGLWHPVAGYAVFVAALIYPLLQISVYLTALAVAALVLPSWVLLRRPGLWLLILAAPLLARWPLGYGGAVLGGAIWGASGGGLGGGLTALWLKIWAVLAEHSPFLPWSAVPLDVASLQARFGAANSWQTVLLLARPFAGSRNSLLHLLQILAWCGGGVVTGLMAQGRAGRTKPPAASRWAALGGILLGAFCLGAGDAALTFYREGSLTPAALVNIALNVGGIVGVGWVVVTIRRYISLPRLWDLPRKTRPLKAKPTSRRKISAWLTRTRAGKGLRASSSQDAGRPSPSPGGRETGGKPPTASWYPPDDDTIKIELD